MNKELITEHSKARKYASIIVSMNYGVMSVFVAPKACKDQKTDFLQALNATVFHEHHKCTEKCPSGLLFFLLKSLSCFLLISAAAAMSTLCLKFVQDKLLTHFMLLQQNIAYEGRKREIGNVLRLRKQTL